MRVTTKTLKKAEAYAAITNQVMFILGMVTDDDGTVIDKETMLPVTINDRICKRYLMNYPVTINPRLNEMELDILTGNINILQYLFEDYLEKNNISYIGYGCSTKRGSKFKDIPNLYSWELVIDNSEDSESYESKYYKNRNFGLIDIILQLENVDMDAEFDIIEENATVKRNKKS